MSLASLPEHRCSCGHILFKGVLMLSHLQVKCHSCRRIVELGSTRDAFNSGKQYALIVHTTIVDRKPRMKIVDCSPSATKIFGYTRDEILAQPPNYIDAIASRGGYDDSFMRHIESDMPPITMETVQICKDGTPLKIRARITNRREAWGISMFVVCDVLAKEGVMLDEELRIMGKQTPNIADQQLELGTKGVINYASSGVANYLGRTVRDLSHNVVFDFLEEKKQAAFKKRFLDAAHARESFVTLLALTTPPGDTKPYEAHFITRYRDDGVFDGYTVTLWPRELSPVRRA